MTDEQGRSRGRAEDRIAAARKRFPGAERWVYLDTGARGLLPVEARAAVEQQLDARLYGEGDKSAMFAAVERLRARFATLVNAGADEVAITKNISEGLNVIAAAMPWEAGDNVVLCPEVEHPNNVYPWLHLRRLRGIEVRRVPAREGRLPVDAVIGAIDRRTRLVTVSTVSFAPGFRTDIEPLGRACRERGVFLLADGAQSVGILHTDVERMGIDGLAVSTQKGLLGLYGLGLLYCRRAWAERLTPVFLARFGVDLGAAHEASLGEEHYRLMPGARRFDLGNYNFLAAVAASESLGLLLDLGTPEIERHVGALARRLAEGLLALGLPVCGGPAGPHLGSIVSVGRIGAGGHDGTDDPETAALYRHLVEGGVKLSIRRGMLRLSLHLYNNRDDVDRVVELVRCWRRAAARPSAAGTA